MQKLNINFFLFFFFGGGGYATPPNVPKMTLPSRRISQNYKSLSQAILHKVEYGVLSI